MLPSTVGCRPLAPRLPPAPINYTPTFTMPFGDGGPHFPTAPAVGVLVHMRRPTNANVPTTSLPRSLALRTMAFNNGYPFPTTTHTVMPPPLYGLAPPTANLVWFQNNF